MMLPRRMAWLIAGILVCGLSPLLTAQTIKREPAKPLRTVEGPENYMRYCAPCHGKTLKGDGPAATAFKVPPTDLTTFAKRHGGKFSHVDLEAHITGTGQPMAAHGSADMPVWGPIFQTLSPDDGDLALRISNLVKYIEAAQVK